MARPLTLPQASKQGLLCASFHTGQEEQGHVSAKESSMVAQIAVEEGAWSAAAPFPVQAGVAAVAQLWLPHSSQLDVNLGT